MKILALFVVAFLVCPAIGDGPHHGKGRHRAEEGSAWLGVYLTWMEEATAVQLNEVPAGFGLLIDEVEVDSPAAEAGLQPLDVLWKYDDQLIANKGQLLALMRHTGVGKQGSLTVSRAGQNLVLPVTIGERPQGQEELAKGAREVLMPPLPTAVMRQVDLGKRSGFIAEGGVIVSLARKQNGFEYSVNEGEKTLQAGTLLGENAALWPATLDDDTRRKLQVLFESLVNAEQRESSPRRTPRVRRVPVPKEGGKK